MIRGGTTSVGLAAAAIAKNHGCYVAASTRRSSPDVEKTMHTSGVEQVLIDDGNIAAQVKDAKFDKVLELVGTVGFVDTLYGTTRSKLILDIRTP